MKIAGAVLAALLLIGAAPVAPGYAAAGGTIAVNDAKGKPLANLSYTAFTLDGAQSSRPLTFFFAGGPGASAMYLLYGSFAPVRLHDDGTKASVEPNSQSLIDTSDLVFPDPPDTGFGRLSAGVKRFEVTGSATDALALQEFVEKYVKQTGRTSSPIYLYGEGYGAFRAAAVAKGLEKDGVRVAGVVLSSPILNFALQYANGAPVGGSDWGYILALPTQAALAWKGGKLSPRPANLAPFLDGVQRYALGGYFDALYAGATLSIAARRDVALQLAGDTGISLPVWQGADLRIQLASPGLLNSTQANTSRSALATGFRWDPADGPADARAERGAKAYASDTLQTGDGFAYRGTIYQSSFGVGDTWSFAYPMLRPADAAPDLAEAIRVDPSLRVFVALGYYDTAVPYFSSVYTLQHLGLNVAQQQAISWNYYEGGHRLADDPAVAGRYRTDLERWYGAKP